MRIVTISSKRQITLPKELMLSLRLKPQNKLLLEREDGFLVVKPLNTSVVEKIVGSLTSYVSPQKLKKPFSFILKETRKKTAQKLNKKV